MEKRQIVAHLLVPTDHHTTETVHPTMSTLAPAWARAAPLGSTGDGLRSHLEVIAVRTCYGEADRQTPPPSVSTLRLVPIFPAVGRVLADLFPPQG